MGEGHGGGGCWGPRERADEAIEWFFWVCFSLHVRRKLRMKLEMHGPAVAVCQAWIFSLASFCCGSLQDSIGQSSLLNPLSLNKST